MVYRLAIESDIGQLAEMKWQYECEENENHTISKEDFISEFIRFLKDGLHNGTWVYWVVEDNGVILSNIYIKRIKKVPSIKKFDAEMGYMTNGYTRAEYRNKGFGSKLLNKVKLWARENHMELLYVWPTERSICFFERHGFSMENKMMVLKF